MEVRNFLNKEEEAQVVSAIKKAELKTSGEIRVHLENRCGSDALGKARMVFEAMGMQNTQQQAGVLLYIAVKDHKIAVVGDTGINAKVAPHFWEDIIAQLQANFKAQQYCSGICTALLSIGEQLSTHFPFQEGDANELSNEISFG